MLLFLQIRPCPERQTPVRRQQRSRWSLGDRGLHGHHLGVQGDLISLHPPNYSFVGLRLPSNPTPVIHVSSPLSTFLSRPSPSSTRSTTASSAPTSTTRAPGTTAVATPAAAEEEEEEAVAAEAPRNPVEADQGGARPRPRRPDCTGKREEAMKFRYEMLSHRSIAFRCYQTNVKA